MVELGRNRSAGHRTGAPSLIRIAALTVLLFAWRGSAAAAELEIRFAVLERVLAQQVFTEEGRKYVRGSKVTPCQFAYLENPKISADKGRLSVRARFTGRSALDFFGRCVGLGGSFQSNILATPYLAEGKIRLKDVVVESADNDSLYIRRVRQALAQSIEKEVQVDVDAAAKRYFAEPDPKGAFQVDLRQFALKAIALTGDAVVLTFDLRVAVK